MEIAPDVFARARKLSRPGVEDLLASAYPSVARIARALSGRADVAEGVVRFVMIRAVAMLPRWRDETAAGRWFLHHTLLTVRRAAGHAPPATGDLLAPDGDPRYVAFVRALRALPVQQREAALLHFGEHLNSRYLGVAMDCSTEAAQAHLDAAAAALRSISAADFDPLLARLGTAYARLAPAPDELSPAARRLAGKALRPRRLRRVVRLLVLAAVVAALAWAGWKWRAFVGL
jgi:DNA-directed RNA polymerase specialized sigma24 family protein